MLHPRFGESVPKPFLCKPVSQVLGRLLMRVGMNCQSGRRVANGRAQCDGSRRLIYNIRGIVLQARLSHMNLLAREHRH
jgi:hypothetical protein